MPDAVVGPGGNNTVAVIPSSNAGPANGSPQPENTWYGSDPEFAKVVTAKGWKSPVDALKSYTELERTHGQVGSRVKEYEDFLTSIAPHWDSFVEWQEANKANAGGNKAEGGKETAEEKMLAQVKAMLDERLKPLGEFQSNYENRQFEEARTSASTRFVKDFPQAKQFEKEIVAILESGEVESKDRLNSNAHYAALRQAYDLARARRMDKDEQAKRAGSTEGGSGGAGRSDGGLNRSLDENRERLLRGEV